MMEETTIVLEVPGCAPVRTNLATLKAATDVVLGNKGRKPSVTDEPATRFAKDQLKAIIERIERLEEEKKTISDDIRDVYAEAKGNGYDVRALRTIVRMRKQDANERAEQETILETYLQALGML
jgi:uncharacterized protein (UPF0335 family)